MTTSATPPTDLTPASAQPGRMLGIAGFIVAFFFSIVGLVLSIVAKVRSRRAGVPNGFATAGIVVGALRLAADIAAVVVLVVILGSTVAQCAQLGKGVHTVHGVTYTCNTD